jgi:RNA polymerase sigma-70 factor (ECF subfamily)
MVYGAGQRIYQMKNKKETQFEQLYESHKDRIYRLCLGFVKDEDQAKDLFQEILIKIWKHLDGFRNESEISTWIYRIAYNTAITFVTKAKKIDDKQTKIPIDLNLADTDYPNSKVDHQLNSLYQAINELPELDRIIATLLLEDSSYRVISEISGISENYVAVKVNRIKTTLGKKLNPLIHGN